MELRARIALLLQINLIFFIKSVEKLAENFEPVTLTPATKHEPSKLFQIKEVSQQAVNKIINKLNTSKAKDAFELDTAFIKNHCSALVKLITIW